MTDIKSNYISGMSIKGGRNNDFYLCLLECFSDSNRLFVKSLLQVKDQVDLDEKEAISIWASQYDLNELVVDSPLTVPICQSCTLNCPGAANCPQSDVLQVRAKMEEILDKDRQLIKENPKKYEQERNASDEFNFYKDIWEKDPFEHILSRSFKRKLKKGYLPYWNRPIDFMIWCYYHDQLLSIFKSTYDSFGNTSLMLHFRFDYLKRHLPKKLELLESNENIILLELFRKKIISKQELLGLSDIDLGAKSRFDILKKIEKYFDFFIYDQEFEIMIKKSKAFSSFILSLSGLKQFRSETRNIPAWASSNDVKFVIPFFK